MGTEVPIGSEISPGFDSIPDRTEETAPVGPDDWYDVSGDDAARTSDEAYAESDSFAALQEWDSTQNRIIAGIALLALLIGSTALVIWRRRRREAEVQNTPNTALASGIRKSIADQMPAVLKDAPDWSKGDGPMRQAQAKADAEASVEPEGELELEPEFDEAEPAPMAESETEPVSEPVSEAPAAPDVAPAAPIPSEPARIDLELEILSATRSMMMFTVEFRLDLCNRSAHAVRDLTVMGKLASAQRGATNAAPLAGGQPLAEIERIGPHKSERISGTLRLPLSDVAPIMQGNKPLLIPLLHIMFEGSGQNPMSRSFVLGTPSAAGTGRVHPLPLDGPPGGLPPLEAQLVVQQDAGNTQNA